MIYIERDLRWGVVKFYNFLREIDGLGVVGVEFCRSVLV